ncbi:putative l-lactate dehydrogenase [Phaeomoniella chlamydospora]|uniref:Putative l-lactate dehydrogenase n=1 Tax=Phaeomoniella chlamydospora TaxID=158046 RepID=A0A0G2E6W3_PHACM|nr:putative l-lactate dehydrogenase [Phaeomoniella chlamydospora]
MDDLEKAPSTSADSLNYVEPDPLAPVNYQRNIYGSFRKPLFSTNAEEWERLARQRIPAQNFGYVYGSASTASTHGANRAAFDRYRLKPRMLVNVTRRDLSVELFGTRYPTPLLAAPIGVQGILHRDAEDATARACKDLQIPMILSTAADRSIEQIAASNGPRGHRWFQLYWPRPQDDCVTISLLDRAAQSGYTALVVTLDTFTLGWRPTDLDTSYLPFPWGQGCAVGFTDPVFNARYLESQRQQSLVPLTARLAESWNLLRRPGTLYGALRMLLNASTLRKSQAWISTTYSNTYHDWSQLCLLRSHWPSHLPILLKGIQTVSDAHLAIKHLGPDLSRAGIIVSNHGGRQLDGAVSSLHALDRIAADPLVRESGITILFDSGIRTGSDVLKALALGAQAVLIGRPYAYGLAIKGEEGVKHVFKCLTGELDNALANLGKTGLRSLGREDLEVEEERRWNGKAKL